jgi:hypothetical protein
VNITHSIFVKKFFNHFRSEEHVRNWSGFKADTEDGMNPLSDILKLFSGNIFTRRLNPDYHSHMKDNMWELMGVLKGMSPFWQPPEH